MNKRKKLMLYWAGGPGFSPANISGLTFWLKADSLALGDGAAVTSWSDSGPNGLTVSQGTGSKQPAYRLTGAPNNRPAVQFDGGDVLSRASVVGSSLISSNQCHVFIVQKQDGSHANNIPLCWFVSSTNLFEMLATFGNTIFFDFGNRTAGQGRISVAQPGGWDDTWRLVQGIREAPDSGTARIRDQGSELTNGAVTQTNSTAGSGTLRVGADETESSSTFSGYIAEILIYNVALSAANRTLIEAYLNARYSLF